MVTQSRRKVVRFIFRGRNSGQTEHRRRKALLFSARHRTRGWFVKCQCVEGRTNVAVIDGANWSNSAGIRQAGLQRISLRET